MMNVKYIVYAPVIFLVNMLLSFMLLPYAQASANSHMNCGPAFGCLLFIGSVPLFIAGLARIKNKDVIFGILLVVFAANLFVWGCKFYDLYCQGCANSG